MFDERLTELEKILKNCQITSKTKTLEGNKSIERFHALLMKTKISKGIVYVLGNGGSAGIASHFSVDFINALKIPSNTLYDSNIMTCISNDYGYEYVFSNQLKVVLKEEDLIVAISSSGKSPNIINAMEVAKKRNVTSVTFSGFDHNNPLRNYGDLNFWLDSKDYGIVETGHFFLLHTVVDAWKSKEFQRKEELVYA